MEIELYNKDIQTMKNIIECHNKLTTLDITFIFNPENVFIVSILNNTTAAITNIKKMFFKKYLSESNEVITVNSSSLKKLFDTISNSINIKSNKESEELTFTETIEDSEELISSIDLLGIKAEDSELIKHCIENIPLYEIRNSISIYSEHLSNIIERLQKYDTKVLIISQNKTGIFITNDRNKNETKENFISFQRTLFSSGKSIISQNITTEKCTSEFSFSNVEPILSILKPISSGKEGKIYTINNFVKISFGDIEPIKIELISKNINFMYLQSPYEQSSE